MVRKVERLTPEQIEELDVRISSGEALRSVTESSTTGLPSHHVVHRLRAFDPSLDALLFAAEKRSVNAIYEKIGELLEKDILEIMDEVVAKGYTHHSLITSAFNKACYHRIDKKVEWLKLRLQWLKPERFVVINKSANVDPKDIAHDMSDEELKKAAYQVLNNNIEDIDKYVAEKKKEVLEKLKVVGK